MPNGFGLMGHNSSTQSSVIIQKPGSTTIYYIFTADYEAQLRGIRYSEVDMTLNAGLGNVTANKNILLNTPSCEKIAGVRHCNNKDVWVVTHDWNSNAFRTYLVTSAGVNTVPVVSNAGLVVNGSVLNTHGQLKASPNGKKLGSAVQGMSFELFDFNNSTGVVSNGIVLPLSAGGSILYGVEFSPDGTKMYGACVSGHIYQFNLCAGSNAAVANSGILINTPAAFRGALQLGPDKKIYVALLQGSWAGVINNPNTLGVGCNFVVNGVALSGRIIRNGFPNFVNYYFKPPPPPFTASVNCLNGIFTAPQVNVTNCSGSSNAISSVLWNFGDPASGINNTSTVNSANHTFSGAGTYTVKLVLSYACGTDTLKQNITVSSCGCLLAGQFTKGTSSCAGCGCKQWIMITATGGTSPYSYLWPDGYTNRYKNDLCPGAYTINIKDKNGCSVNVNLTTP
ncbi:MAG: PKD domain-containing protein [Bacteroidetes bacterium]|nr:PKD domain-containing protein [Bacteroidota bacterium]